MSYISFGNKELFEFVNPEKYLLSLLTWEKKHTVRFETPRWKCNKCGSKFLQYFKENQEVALCKKCWKEGILTFPEPTTRLEVGDVIDLYWRSRVPPAKKSQVVTCPNCGVSGICPSVQFRLSMSPLPPFYLGDCEKCGAESINKIAHNLSDIIGKAVITSVWKIVVRKKDGKIEFISPDVKVWDRTKIGPYDIEKFAKEDGFDSLEKFEGYFSKNLKEGETKIGTVYEYEKYKEGVKA